MTTEPRALDRVISHIDELLRQVDDHWRMTKVERGPIRKVWLEDGDPEWLRVLYADGHQRHIDEQSVALALGMTGTVVAILVDRVQWFIDVVTEWHPGEGQTIDDAPAPFVLAHGWVEGRALVTTRVES